MSLKTYRVDIPTALVGSFVTLAGSEAEALALVTAACAGDRGARKTVQIIHSPPLACPSQRRIRTAEPGTPEEKVLMTECVYVTSALIQLEAADHEN